MDKKTITELITVRKELAFENREKEKRAAELYIANKELAFENQEKGKRAAELLIANTELIFQNDEKEKRAAELAIANKELAFHNQEKENRAAELLIANRELIFQNDEKEKRAAELAVANKELAFQNQEKENRAAELLIANKELVFQNNEKEKRAAELATSIDELRKSKDQFQLMVSSIKDYAIFKIDKYGYVATWNSGAHHIKGYNEEEIIGQSINVFYTQAEIEDREPQRNLQMALQYGHLETEGFRVRKDGTLFYADVTFTALFDNNGNHNGYAKVTRDISEKRKTEENVRFLASIASNIQDPVISTDSAYNITRWNDAAWKLFGWTSEEAIGKSHSELLKIKFLDTDMTKIIEQLHVKHAWQGEAIYYSKSGQPLNVLVTASHLKDDKGHITGNFMALVRDITERKRNETEILAVNNELESFSYSVSHDLRAPLRAIHGYTKMLKGGYEAQLDAEGGRLMNNIMNNAKKMGQLIDDLLAFSRIGRHDLVKMDIPMQALVTNLWFELEKEQSSRYIEFRIQNLISSKADYTAIRQIWFNLISNAIKYSRNKEKAVIEIGSEVKDNELVYYIKDNGAGFDMRYVGKLFGVFQRLHSDEEFEGTGVGLALVQRLVFKHGGRIWGEGKVNEGAAFYFTLNNVIS